MVLCFAGEEVELHTPGRVVIAKEIPQIHLHIISGEKKAGIVMSVSTRRRQNDLHL